MTSSGRRVKRRNLDGEESSHRNNRSRKSRSGQKSSRRKSSHSKSKRPRRAAARNALSFLSRISGKASEGEEEEEEEEEGILEGESSESYSSQEETEAGSEETEVSNENEENRDFKGKEIVSEDVGTHQNTPKRRLVFKIPNRDSSKQESAGPSSTTHIHEIDESPKNFSSSNGNCEHILDSSENGSPMNNMVHGTLVERNIKWGSAKSRSSKRPRITAPIPPISESKNEPSPDAGFKIENHDHSSPTAEKEEFAGPSSSSGIHIEKGKTVMLDQEQEDNLDKETPIPVHMKLRIIPTKLKIKSSVLELRNREGNMLSDGSTSDIPDQKITEMPLEATRDDNTLNSDIQDSHKLNSRDKMFKEVYRRSKSTRRRTSLGTNGVAPEASTSNAANNINRAEQIEPSTHETQRKVNFSVVHDISEDTSSKEKSSTDGGDEIAQEEEEDRLRSRHNVGLRSTRSRRPIDYNLRDKSPEKRKPHQSTRSSWLMLTAHEEGSRYIPQFGDEIVYLRQVRCLFKQSLILK